MEDPVDEGLSDRHVFLAKERLCEAFGLEAGPRRHAARAAVDYIMRAAEDRIKFATSNIGFFDARDDSASRQVRRLDVALAAEKAAHTETRARLESAESALRSMNADWPDGRGREVLAHFAKYPPGER